MLQEFIKIGTLQHYHAEVIRDLQEPVELLLGHQLAVAALSVAALQEVFVPGLGERCKVFGPEIADEGLVGGIVERFSVRAEPWAKDRLSVDSLGPQFIVGFSAVLHQVWSMHQRASDRLDYRDRHIFRHRKLVAMCILLVLDSYDPVCSYLAGSAHDSVDLHTVLAISRATHRCSHLAPDDPFDG